MAYSKVSNKSQDKDIKYLNKDFTSFKNQLLEFAEVYFPNNFNDFSEGNPGMMFLEMAAYVGDVLSFYTDTQLRESFLTLAQEKENLYNLAYALGYTPRATKSASTNLNIFQLIPSKVLGSTYVPDYDYALRLSSNAQFSTNGNQKFFTDKLVDFSFSSSFDPTTVSVYQYDSSNNPEYFLLKKSSHVISGEIKSEKFPIGDAEKFKTLTLFDSNIVQIISVVDSDGNEYKEVPYLAQDTVFEEVENTGANDFDLKGFSNQTPYLLKLTRINRRFISRFKNTDELELQFGAGNIDKSDEEIIPNPDNIGLGIKDGRSKLDIAYDPSNFLFTRAYGQAPANTTLTVTYVKGGGIKSNVGSNTIINKENLSLTPKINNANVALVSFCKNSLSVTNPEAAKGGGEGDTAEEIRMNTMAEFSAQKRTVTKDDYLIRTLSLPPRFGRIAKAYITQDDQISPLPDVEKTRIPNPLALNLYTLGYSGTKKLTTLNTATKTNLSTYLDQFRTLTDAVNIKDAFVINFAIEFEITVFKNYNNESVLLDCITEIRNYFNIDRWQINQPIIISEVENLIAGVRGAQTLESISFENKSGTTLGYSAMKYDFGQATRNGVIYPSLDPSIFELKFPNTDIKGRVTTY